MVRVSSSLLVAISLFALAGCNGANVKKDADKLDAELATKGNDADPALTAALEDQIMVDPSLAGPGNVNSARPADAPLQAPVPPEKADEAVSQRTGTTLGQLAANQAHDNKENFSGCGLDVDYSMTWANRLPTDLPLYPQARVAEAAGSDTGKCRLRAVTFSSSAPLRNLVDFYIGAAKRGGYSAEHKMDGSEHVVAGSRGDGSAYYVILAAQSGGGTTADLVANNGS
jgi:hypothetical protein